MRTGSPVSTSHRTIMASAPVSAVATSARSLGRDDARDRVAVALRMGLRGGLVVVYHQGMAGRVAHALPLRIVRAR